ncbi:hypothetical protein [Paenibacillus naphthalenovorans]|uniref:hypothetical protein n=1 Tax=Paenibacillus naphthalenovorans TaxID=162209 RepID=UPI000784D256|nr:hypothetical protein [Paenibacillus naphthalenovorans]
MKPESMIGKLVEITDEDSGWAGNWGFIRAWDGQVFHVSGGSIPESQHPIFDRDQFKVPRKLDAYFKKGWLKLDVNITSDGREIRK